MPFIFSLRFIFNIFSKNIIGVILLKVYRNLFLMTYLFVAVIGFAGKIAVNTLPEIKITYTEKENISHYVSVSGTINITEYGVFPSLSSDVESIYVKEGDKVSKDETLAWVKNNDFASPVMAGIENYENDLYNRYASAFAKLIDDSGISDIYDGVKLKMLSKYTSVVQDTKQLKSPVDGVVTKINVREGENTGVALPAFVVSDYGDVTVLCRISEDKIDEVKTGQSVTVSGLGLKHSYKGKVTSIASKANAVLLSGETSSVDVVVSIINPDSDIISGFSANCKICTGIDRDAVILSTDAIHQDETGSEYIYTMVNGKISKEYIDCEYISSRKVKLNDFNENIGVILSENDLKEGERVKIKE